MPLGFENGASSSVPSPKPRSSTGNHVLLPAFDVAQTERIYVPVATKENLISWTFGRGTVVSLTYFLKKKPVPHTVLVLENMACGVAPHRVCCWSAIFGHL